MICFKCDRCGKTFDDFNKTRGWEGAFLVKTGTVTIYLTEFYDDKGIALCQECRDSFDKWFEEGGE